MTTSEERPTRVFVVDLAIHDYYSDGFPPPDEPIAWYVFGPFPNEEAAVDWGNRTLQFFGTLEGPMEDPRKYEDG